MSYKICLLSDHHISVNPRLWKEAFFYERKGFEVTILNKWQSKEMLEKDLEILEGSSVRYKCYLNMIPGTKNSMSRFYYRMRKRISCEMQKYFKAGGAWAINHGPDLMYKIALKEQADLYIAHLETAFYAGRKLIQTGKRVAYDFEDWYSRDYLIPERPVKLLEKLERFALLNGLFCTATSQSMATALQTQYSIEKPVIVIYNGFQESEFPGIKEITIESNADTSLKLLWFSRTIGPDRGIGTLLKALSKYNTPVELHLLGDIGKEYQEILERIFPYDKKHELIIHPFIPHSKLNSFIAQFQIGLSIEENINDNKKLTISNKLLQYLQAGIPVLATSTRGQLEVASFFPETIKVVDIEQPEQWHYAIESLRNVNNEKMIEQKKNYKSIFSWEAQESKLNKLLEKHL